MADGPKLPATRATNPPFQIMADELEATGKAKGGHARARLLTPEQRSAIAKRAAKARWTDEPILKATAGGGEGDRLLNFASGKAISPFISEDLLNRMKAPIPATYESVEPAQVMDAGATPSAKGVTESAQDSSSQAVTEVG